MFQCFYHSSDGKKNILNVISVMLFICTYIVIAVVWLFFNIEIVIYIYFNNFFYCYLYSYYPWCERAFKSSVNTENWICENAIIHVHEIVVIYQKLQKNGHLMDKNVYNLLKHDSSL